MSASEDESVIDIIDIKDYDPEWPNAFELEKSRIMKKLGELVLEIQHIGSTAVPGISAKPIIDILIAVRDMGRAMECAIKLADLGYELIQSEDDVERLFLFRGMPRTHHIHIVEHGSETHRKHVVFRDYLREHADTRNEYDRLKRALAARYRTDRKSYVDSKTDFVERVVEKATWERDGMKTTLSRF
jgi:GrpB-like predicted nucleotidyltransferase (UPF0157 family)